MALRNSVTSSDFYLAAFLRRRLAFFRPPDLRTTFFAALFFLLPDFFRDAFFLVVFLLVAFLRVAFLRVTFFATAFFRPPAFLRLPDFFFGDFAGAAGEPLLPKSLQSVSR